MTFSPDEESPEPVAALLVFGEEVPPGALENAGIQVELFLEELDRSLGENDTSRFEWRVLDPTFGGSRVKVGATPRTDGQGMQPAGSILDHARWGIAALRRSPRRPPAFSTASLRHLVEVAGLLHTPSVSQLVFYADRTSEPITLRTLENLESLIAADAS